MASTDVLSPFVYWAQDKQNVYLKVDIRSAKDVNVNVANKGRFFEFSAVNSHNQRYQFHLKLADQIENDIKTKVSDLKVELVLPKRLLDHALWNSLIEKTLNERTPAWLKFDFDRWKSDESSDEEVNKGALSEEDYYKNVWNTISKDKRGNIMSVEDLNKKINMMTSTYLFAYNVCMFMAHFFVLTSLLSGYFLSNKDYLNEFWSEKFSGFVTCTLLQYLDVLNCLLGVTKSKWQITSLQVTGRLAVLYIIEGNPEIHSWLPVYVLLIVYFMGEQFRYPYYALNSLSITLTPITWLRYNHFLLFYPIGFMMEALIFIRSIPFYYASGLYGMKLPNALNISFNFGAILAIVSTSFFPYAALTLFGHMRTKKLSKLVGNLNSKKKRRNTKFTPIYFVIFHYFF